MFGQLHHHLYALKVEVNAWDLKVGSGLLQPDEYSYRTREITNLCSFLLTKYPTYFKHPIVGDKERRDTYRFLSCSC